MINKGHDWVPYDSTPQMGPDDLIYHKCSKCSIMVSLNIEGNPCLFMEIYRDLTCDEVIAYKVTES